MGIGDDAHGALVRLVVPRGGLLPVELAVLHEIEEPGEAAAHLRVAVAARHPRLGDGGAVRDVAPEGVGADLTRREIKGNPHKINKRGLTLTIATEQSIVAPIGLLVSSMGAPTLRRNSKEMS